MKKFTLYLESEKRCVAYFAKKVGEAVKYFNEQNYKINGKRITRKDLVIG